MFDRSLSSLVRNFSVHPGGVDHQWGGSTGLRARKRSGRENEPVGLGGPL